MENSEKNLGQSLIVVNPAIMLAGFEQLLKKYLPKDNPNRLHTINQIAIKLGLSHHKVKKMVQQGIISATSKRVSNVFHCNFFVD
jgi:hypothetical protein